MRYSLCWCGAGFPCEDSEDFRKPVGELTVFAPVGSLTLSCDVFDASGPLPDAAR